MTEILTESFCERCGTRYTFESTAPRQKRMGGIRILGRGLKNFVLSDDSSLDEAMAAARSDVEREATAQQLDAFHRTFNFCMSCRQYTCGNCWNGVDARCLSCAPLPEAEIVAHEHISPPTEVDLERLLRLTATPAETAWHSEAAPAPEVLPEPEVAAEPEPEPELVGKAEVVARADAELVAPVESPATADSTGPLGATSGTPLGAGHPTYAPSIGGLTASCTSMCTWVEWFARHRPIPPGRTPWTSMPTSTRSSPIPTSPERLWPPPPAGLR